MLFKIHFKKLKQTYTEIIYKVIYTTIIMQTITPKDNIDVTTDPLKLARDKYYANNRHTLREKQK